MKKFLAVLGASAAIFVLASGPAYAVDIDEKRVDDADVCGGLGNRSSELQSWQWRSNEGTPNDPSDDRIAFDRNPFGGEDRVSVPLNDLDAVFSRSIKIIKKTNDGNETVFLGITYNDTVQNWYFDPDGTSWIPVNKEPFVRVETTFDNGAVCTMKSSWNPAW